MRTDRNRKNSKRVQKCTAPDVRVLVIWLLMGKRDELKEDNLRMKRIGKESERQEGAKYSLWEKLGKLFIGREEDQERRDYTTRKPDPE